MPGIRAAGGHVMQCSFDIGCLASEFWQWVTSEAGRQALWQFLKDMAAIAGVVLASLKWWEKREAYIFGRPTSVLGEQASQTHEALRYVLNRIRRPGPADRPRVPVFAELALRRLFGRHHWKPVLSFAGPFTSADRKLRRIHRRLDKRERAATGYRNFVNEQRFAAHMLQAAIALGRSERAKTDNHLSRFNQAAANSLHRALTVSGKENDLDALELKGIVLRKLRQIDFDSEADAPEAFEHLRKAAEAQLAALDESTPDRRLELIYVISRAVRYQAEMLHARLPSTATGRDLLDGIAATLDTKERPSPQQLLDRARFFEVDTCIRWILHGPGPITMQRLSAAERDYSALRDDCDPKSWDWPTRIWRSCARAFRDDGARELLREAEAGLVRLQRIAQGQGCPLCEHHPAYQDDANRTATPTQ
jgi:hypothetical protein